MEDYLPLPWTKRAERNSLVLFKCFGSSLDNQTLQALARIALTWLQAQDPKDERDAPGIHDDVCLEVLCH